MNLVLNSYGATLQKENDLFVISTADGKQSVPPGKVTSITISKAARITSDAVLLAIQHEVDILFVNDMGMPEGRVWSIKYGSVSNLRRAQLDFIYSPKVINWVKDLLVQKINGQAALLLALQPPPDKVQLYNVVRFAVNSMEDYKNKIVQCEGEVISDVSPSLRGWEGAAGKKYFSTVSKLLPAEYAFETRTRLPAYAGIFHRDEYNRPALVYDAIEPYRVWMDYVVIQLCREKAIPADCFIKDEETGGIRLEALGKRILIQSVNDYLAEIIDMDGKERSRLTHIHLEAQQMGQYFQKHSL